MKYGKYKATLSTNGTYIDKEEEFDLAEYISRDYWESKSQDGQEDLLNDIADDLMTHYQVVGWEEVE